MTFLKLLILILVVAGIARAVNKGWAQLIEYNFELTIRTVAWIVFSGCLYVAALVPMAIYWFRVLRAMDQRPPFWTTMRAYFLGHLGKYVPGKAMVVVLRTGSLKQTNSTVTAISVFAETLAMMAVGAFLAAAIIAVQFADKSGFLLTSAVLMLLAGVPTFPPVFRFIVLTLKVDKVDEAVTRALDKYSWRLVLSGWASSLIGWSVMAFSLWALLQAFHINESPVGLFVTYSRMLASVSLAVVAGFLSLLPGRSRRTGIGLQRTAVTKPYGPAVAMICPVLLRLTWLFAELLTAGVFQLFHLRTFTGRISMTETSAKQTEIVLQ